MSEDTCRVCGCLRSQFGEGVLERCGACGDWYDPQVEDCPNCYEDDPWWPDDDMLTEFD